MDDPGFKLHTAYHKDMFLLRLSVLVNEQKVDLKEKENSPILSVSVSPNVSTAVASQRKVASEIFPILHMYGVYHLAMFYYEQDLLYHVFFRSESCLAGFLEETKAVQSFLKEKLSLLLFPDSKKRPDLNVELDIYLASPGSVTKLLPLTKENHSSLITLWKQSNCFDFGTVFQSLTEAKPPSIIAQPDDVENVYTADKTTVSFNVEYSGTPPIYLEWQQWNPDGNNWIYVESEQWNPDSLEDVTQNSSRLVFDNAEPPSCAKRYQCVITNVAGSVTSKTAYFVSAAKMDELVDELNVVDEWLHLGIFLHMKPHLLKAIKNDYSTTSDCRMHMLVEWGKQEIPTWSSVVLALKKLGREKLASKLANAHGIPVPEYCVEETTECKVLQKFGGVFQMKICESEQVEIQILEARRQQSDIIKSEEKLLHKIKVMETQLSAVAEVLHNVTDERDKLKTELQDKENEIKLPHKMKQVMIYNDPCNKYLCKRISELENEMETLNVEVSKKEHQLEATEQCAKKLEIKLSAAKQKLQKYKKSLKEKKSKEKKLMKQSRKLKMQLKLAIDMVFDTKQSHPKDLSESENKMRKVGYEDVDLDGSSEEGDEEDEDSDENGNDSPNDSGSENDEFDIPSPGMNEDDDMGEFNELLLRIEVQQKEKEMADLKEKLDRTEAQKEKDLRVKEMQWKKHLERERMEWKRKMEETVKRMVEENERERMIKKRENEMEMMEMREREMRERDRQREWAYEREREREREREEWEKLAQKRRNRFF